MKSSRSEFITVRGLRYHIRHWGDENAPTLFMLHGWMDVSASFQFVVDCLRRDWHVIAPDWRGFGLTTGPKTDSYWFPDYLADLDAILERYSPGEPARIVGHSMGGNVTGLYAGARPERVRRFVNLEGFGLTGHAAGQAPARYAKWLGELQAPPPMRTYASQAEVAARLQKNNPRLSDERAAFLSSHWAQPNADGRWEILGDPAHRVTNPVLYRLEEVEACWRAITAPVLCVEAADTDMRVGMPTREAARAEIDRRLAWIPNRRYVLVPDAGHMLHHDQPERLAALIDDFFP